MLKKGMCVFPFVFSFFVSLVCITFVLSLFVFVHFRFLLGQSIKYSYNHWPVRPEYSGDTPLTAHILKIVAFIRINLKTILWRCIVLYVC